MEKIDKYIASLESLRKTASIVECNNCGSKTLTNGTVSICNFCELAVMSSMDYSVNAELFKSISILIDKGMIAEALSSLNNFSKSASDPISVYVTGVFYEFISNYMYNNINYSRAGFMEENSLNIYASLDMISKAKEQFFKTLSLISSSTSKESDIFYLEFITNIKLKRSFNAKMSLKELNSHKTGETYNAYSNMVYAVTSRNKNAELFINPVIKRGEVNVFYYISKYFAENKKIEDSILLLSELIKAARMPMAFYFLKKVKNVHAAMEI